VVRGKCLEVFYTFDEILQEKNGEADVVGEL
jgi:hypothetical protein